MEMCPRDIVKTARACNIPLKRMEENQRNAMHLWKECGNGEPVFVRYPGDEIWLFGYSVLCYLESKGWIADTEGQDA